MADLTFVGISGSLRQASRNTGLLRCCAAHLPAGVRMEIADISALPFYNADLEKPKAAQALIEQVSRRTPWCWPARNTTIPWPRP